MGTEINAIVQRILKESNINNDSKIDKKEIQIFEYGLNFEVAKGNLSVEQMQTSLHDVIRKHGTNEVKEDYMIDQVTITNPIQNNGSHNGAIEYNKKDLSRAYQHIQNIVNVSVTKSSNLDELIANIEKGCGKLAQDSRYSAPFIERVKYIKETYLNNIDNYKVTTELEKAHEKIVKDMAQDEYKGLKLDNAFDLDLLDALETVGKKEIYAKTKTEFVERFEALWAQNVDGDKENITISNVLSQIEKDVTNSGANKFNRDQKEAFNYLKNEYAKGKAEAIIATYVDEIDNTNGVKENKKDIKAELKAAGLWDDYTKDIYNNKSTKNNVKSKVKEVKINENRTKYSKDEILKKLDSENRPLFEALVAQGLITQIDGSDKYDITNLTILLSTLAGSDDHLNRTTGDFKTLSEQKILLSRLKAVLNDNVKPSDRKKLADLCGISYEKINWGKVIGNAVTFGALDAAETGLLTLRNLVQQSVITGGDLLKIIGKVNITQYTNVNITMSDIEKLGLQELITVNAKNEVIFDFTRLHKMPEVLQILPLDIRPAIHAAYQAGALAAVAGALKGMESKEIPVTTTTFECQTFDEYLAFINEHHKGDKKLIEALALLASTFIDNETGVWDCESYKNFLQIDEAGAGSVLNKKELYDKIYKLKVIPETPEKGEENTFTPKVITLQAGVCPVEGTKSEDVVIKDATRSSWEEVLKQYGGCLEETFGSKYNAIRVLKIAQAITDGDYSVERLQYLLEQSLKGSRYMKNIDGLDFDVYYDKLTATTMPKELKLPVQLGDCDLLDVTLNKANIKDIRKKGDSGYKEAGGYAKGTVSCDGESYWTKLGDEDKITYDDKKTWNNYIENFEEAQDVKIKLNVPCEEE
ncbi:hypothetical protein IJD34_09740 [bacterium]|nr:hypothetical protein [bacterium]